MATSSKAVITNASSGAALSYPGPVPVVDVPTWRALVACCSETLLNNNSNTTQHNRHPSIHQSVSVNVSMYVSSVAFVRHRAGRPSFGAREGEHVLRADPLVPYLAQSFAYWSIWPLRLLCNPKPPSERKSASVFEGGRARIIS
ncbi:hypothetical protein FDECE_11512 [Fusarium decemcellulare]|nr:hypothetical protein FDECE_11512 [Fusarium decemcellulare]